MTEEQKRIKLAESFGWKRSTCATTWQGWAAPGDDPNLCATPAMNLPDYFNEQKLVWDCIHEYFRGRLPDEYLINLLLEIGAPVCGGFESARKTLSATAAQHCEAFGRTLNLWT